MGIYIDKCKKRKKNKCFACDKQGCYRAKNHRTSHDGKYACDDHKDDLVRAIQHELPEPDDGYRSNGESQAMRSAGIRW